MGVAETKGAIYEALPVDGTAVINADDAFAEYFASRVPDRRILRFGLESSADITARDIRPTADGSQFVLVAPHGEVAVDLHLPGRHNVLNALAAATLAMACGVSLGMIADGLAAAQPVAGRQILHTLPSGAVLIDDSYNANPGSLYAGIDLLAAGGGEAWLVLGDMRELGQDGEALHAEAGRRARAAGIRRLYTLGPLSEAASRAFGEGARSFENHASLVEALRADLHAGVRCLVKGSRGSAMDRIVAALLSTGEDTPHAA
jgi:UDP-N-acetylmuramoyl-tripeptide--D-alanyl-D-alanine ligase